VTSRHVIGNHAGIVRLILERVADVAVETAQWGGRSPVSLKAVCHNISREILLAVSTSPMLFLRGRWNDEAGLQRALRSEGGVLTLTSLKILAGAAVGRDLVGKARSDNW